MISTGWVSVWSRAAATLRDAAGDPVQSGGGRAIDMTDMNRYVKRFQRVWLYNMLGYKYHIRQVKTGFNKKCGPVGWSKLSLFIL